MSDNYVGQLGDAAAMLAAFELAGVMVSGLGLTGAQKALSAIIAAGSVGFPAAGSTAKVVAGNSGFVSI